MQHNHQTFTARIARIEATKRSARRQKISDFARDLIGIISLIVIFLGQFFLIFGLNF